MDVRRQKMGNVQTWSDSHLEAVWIAFARGITASGRVSETQLVRWEKEMLDGLRNEFARRGRPLRLP